MTRHFESLQLAIPRGASHALRWLGGLLSVGWLMLLPGSLFAQTEPSEPFTPESLLSPLPEVLSEGTLQPKARLWLSDRNGNMVLAPEEFAEDYFSSRGKGPAGGNGMPADRLQRVELDLTVDGDVAQVVGLFTAQLSNDYATSIPLSLGSVQFSQWEFSGPAAQNRLLPVRDEPGWRWIVQSQPDTASNATLHGVTRVVRDVERKHLLLTLPTAPCIVHVKLPSNAVDARVRSEDVMQRKTIDGIEQLEITSMGGEFSLSWRDQEQVAQAAAIHATSETKFDIVDPAQPWRATTKLTVRWNGRDASNQIRLALPPGGLWRPVPSSDFERYRITSIHAEGGDAEATTPDMAASLPVLLENFDVERYKTLELDLEWEWTPGAQTNESFETEVHVATPLVHGVDQHTGFVDCDASSAYAVVFKEGAGAQLDHQGPGLDPFRQQLRFHFDRQSYDLTLTFRREQSLPTVRPTYLAHVDRNKLTLTMWLDCSFDTNQPQMELGLILDDWVLQENTARIVKSRDDLFSSSGEILRVQQQADRNYVIRSAKGDVTSLGTARHIDQIWRIVAERTWNADDRELTFQVPQIIRGQVNSNQEIDHGSGALLVTSDSNILLNWHEVAGTGLQRDSFSTEYGRFVPNPGVRKPLVYRFQSSETVPVWAGRVELLARQVSLEQHVDLEVAATQIAIRQDFEMQVANEPLEQLQFAVRKDIADLQSPQVLINGQLVSVTPVTVIDETSLIQLQTPLKQPQRLSERVVSESAKPEQLNELDASDVGERPPSPSNLPRSNKATEGGAESGAKGTATTDDHLGSTERSGIRSTQPSTAGASAQWQIYQVHGGPDALIGATHVTIQTSTPWKGDSRPALSTADRPTEIGTRGTDATKQTRPAASARPGAPSTPQDVNYDVVVPLAQLLLPSSTTRLRQDWSLHTNLQIETLFKSDELNTADAWLAGQRERPLAEQQLAIELKLQPRHLQGVGPVRVDRCWLQTFVGGGKRRERFAIHVESNIDELRLKLPPEAIIREVKVSVDGFAEIDFKYDPQTGVVTIPLGTANPTGYSVGHVVEVSYFLPGELNWVTALDISPPEILGVEHADLFFWQLLTPAEQHLGWSPRPLTAEWTWQWSGLWWNRVSGKNQQQLEKWIGAVVQQSPPASANSYVMSGRGLEGSTRVWVLSRFVLWLPIGLLAIAVSFIALNFAVVRKPVVVLALAAGIASLATLWPDLAVLAGQTAVASLGLVGLVWVVQAGVEARVRRRSVFAARPSTYVDRSDQVSASRSARAIPSPQTTSFGSSAGHHAG
jgi:hypothetical protein